LTRLSTHIENPAPSKGSYGDWLGENKKPTQKDDLRRLIDEVAPLSATFEDFLAKLKERGCVVSTKRKQPSLIAPGWKKPFRLDSLGDDYTEAVIRTRLGKARIITSGSDSGTRNAPSLLIDIQAKIREGKGAAYEQWAKIFNLKQAAKTLLFLQEQGIDSYDDLKGKQPPHPTSLTRSPQRLRMPTKSSKTSLNCKSKSRHTAERGRSTRLTKRAGWDRAYYDANAADIILHRAAKKFFDAQGFKTKLPSINSYELRTYCLKALAKANRTAGFMTSQFCR